MPIAGTTRKDQPSTKQQTDTLCPYCGESPLVAGKCLRCGTICNRCGTPYLADYCPVCYDEGGGEEERVQASMGATATPAPFGDVAPSRSDLSKILDHEATLKEHNIARGIHVDSVQKSIHDRASAAIAQLNVSAEVRARVLERVEREVLAIKNKQKNVGSAGDEDGARKGGVSLEKAVAFAFLRQCREIGRTVEEMQEVLARAGFRIRLEPVHIAVATQDPASLRLYVNSTERKVRLAAAPRLVRIPIYLSDLFEADGDVEISLGGGAIIDIRSPYEFSQENWRKVRIFAGKRCFYLFKAEKEVTVWSEWAANRTPLLTAPPSVNVEAVMKRFLPSKFPISSMLMTAAGCLRDVELRFVTLFREMIRNSHGRAPDNIAADALYKADQEVFALLPDSERNLVQSMIVRMGLARGGYLGKRGLLLKSEVGFDERIVSEDWKVGGRLS
jgi:hypothetical protein